MVKWGGVGWGEMVGAVWASALTFRGAFLPAPSYSGISVLRIAQTSLLRNTLRSRLGVNDVPIWYQISRSEIS